MVALPDFSCPTLDSADRALAEGQDRRWRSHLGMSQIGGPCDRALWFSFRWVQKPNFDAATLKRFEDGHRTEDLVVARLKLVPGIELHEKDERGEQFRFEDFGGHFSGSCDGVALGLLEAPKTWHILEIKASEKWTDLDKARKKVGEKNALSEWNATYYAQAALYMHYAGLERHYIVAASPGGRRWTAVRTDADPVHAETLRARAEKIIFTDEAPPKIGEETFFQCRFCDFSELCHGGEPKAERNCRTCINVTPERDGSWKCSKFGHALSKDDLIAGCSEHRFLPTLVPFEQIDAHEWGIVYRKPDGSEWTDKGDAL